MMNRILQKALVACLFAAILSASPAADAGTFSPPVGEICRNHTADLEKQQRLPSHLLSAISLAESRRWHHGEKASYPWPWTVTSGHDSHYYKDKQSAIAAVRRLQQRGVRNTDVGCMQINLHYHPDAFADLEEPFDPAANVGYAADFLKRLFAETRSWNQSIGRYHSATPARAEGYLHRVKGLWRAERVRAEAVRREQVKAAYRERQAALRTAREERNRAHGG